MKAYARALHKDIKVAEDLLKTIKTKAIIKDDTAHWTHDRKESKSDKIETSAYVLLAMAHVPNHDRTLALQVVQWLIKQQNSMGGFVSTQDTVIAIQALESYHSQFHQKFNNGIIQLKTTNFNQYIRETGGNQLKLYEYQIPSADTNLEVLIAGKGCAWIQITQSYNTETNKASKLTEMTISTMAVKNQHKKKKITICGKFIGPFEEAKMLMIEVEMVTGYAPDLQSLNRLKKLISKFEVDGNGKVVLYIGRMAKNIKKCLSIIVTQQYASQNAKPATVKFYDYYQPELGTFKQYNLEL
ncbi:C3 and PZP-like, alpha-2-macroglobulin domain containing 8 [Chamberlinius hualienensis]